MLSVMMIFLGGRGEEGLTEMRRNEVKNENEKIVLFIPRHENRKKKWPTL